MVLHITLVLGLICAGVAVGQSSWPVSRNQEHADNRDTSKLVRILSSSIGTEKKECNECLRTAIKLIEGALDAEKHDENFWAHDPCNDFSKVQKEMCYNLIDYLKASPVNIMESRIVCIKAFYCHSKDQNPHHKSTVIPKVKGVRHNHDTTTKKPIHHESLERANVENKTSENVKLQLLAINPQYCEDCKAILDKMKNLLQQNWFFPSIITSVCEAFSRRSSCYEMVYKNEGVIAHLLNRTPSEEICNSIKWCRKRRDYPYCKACQNLLFYDADLENESYYWEHYACNYLEGNSMQQCLEALKERRKKLLYYIERDYPIYDTCVALNLCHKKLYD